MIEHLKDVSEEKNRYGVNSSSEAASAWRSRICKISSTHHGDMSTITTDLESTNPSSVPEEKKWRKPMRVVEQEYLPCEIV